MIAIVRYNAGNIMSVRNAVTRLGYESIITDDQNELERADKVIFPGVGEAGSAMAYLKERKLDQTIISLRQPILGICLGLQLLCRFTEMPLELSNMEPYMVLLLHYSLHYQ